MDDTKAIDALLALAQPTRLRAFKHLVTQGTNGLPAGAIAAAAGVPHNTMSSHLAQLQRAGLISARREGRSIIYAVDLAGTMALLRHVLTDSLRAHPDVRGQLLELVDAMGGASRHLAPLIPAGAPRHVLFLCTANSARSIMAEVLLNARAAGRFVAHSAGSQPARGPARDVVAYLSGLGHDTSGLRSKSWTLFSGEAAPRIDIFISLCDVFRGQACPDFGKGAVHAAWPLPDPQLLAGDAAERSAMLNELHAGLSRRIEMLVALPVASLDRRTLKARLQRIGAGFPGALRRMEVS
jgi:protein-tyrosine-phosphatase/DNA-binding transcriptional ArsR family regulator